MWKIQLILEPVGNGRPAAGGKDGVWEKGDGLHPMERAEESFWEISNRANGKIPSGGKV